MPKRVQPSRTQDGSEQNGERGPLKLRKDALISPSDGDEEYDARSDSSDDSNSTTSQNPDFMYKPTMAETCQIGNIQKVILKNFMCHNKLEIKLGSHVNFIIGRNGSGKSAVVSAIIVGLGGKASATSRGGTVRGFIKNGKQTAQIIIHLSNVGIDAYKPDMYGHRIIVERKLMRDGASSYRIKSATGQIISNKQEELRNILDYFNILVDNPIVILNQEISRSFLSTKNASDKYRFFLQATQLAQIQSDYNDMKVEKNSTKEILAKKEESFPSLESEVREWQKKYKAFSVLENQKDKIKKLKLEMAWSFVTEKESTLAPHLSEKETEEARLPKFEQKCTESNLKLQKAQEKLDELNKMSETLGSNEQDLVPELKAEKQKLLNTKIKLRGKQMEIRKMENNIRIAQQDGEQLKERIHELKNSSIRQDYEAEKKNREEKIQSLKEMIKNTKEQKHAHEVQKELFHDAVNSYRNELHRLDSEIRNVNTSIERNRRELSNLKASTKNKLRKYGAHMPDIIARIESDFKQGRFHKKPIGPIGEWMKVKDPRWVLAIESCLKALISAFCVHDHDDSRQLEKIFREMCPDVRRPMFIVSQFQTKLYDVSAQALKNCPFSTVLDMLETKNPVVGNCLIDQRSIENIILIETGQEARSVMRKKLYHFVRETFTLEGDQVFPEPNYRYYSSNLERSQYLSATMEDIINNCESQLHSRMEERSTLQEQKEGLTTQINSNLKEERETEKVIRKYSTSILKVNSEIEELEMIEDPEPVDVLALEDEFDKVTKNQLLLKQNHDSTTEEYVTIQTELKTAEKVFLEKEHQLRSLTAKLESFKEDHAKAQSEFVMARSHHVHYKSKMEEQQKKINGTKSKIERIQNEIKVDTEKAQLICADRVNTRRTPQNIQSEITEIIKLVQETEKTQGDRDFTTCKYHETKGALMKIKKEVASLKSFLNHLDEVIDIRDKAYKSCRLLIALRMKQVFVVFLHSRKYDGHLTFDHDKGLLEISVSPMNAEGKGSKDMRSLSGGERSFATVCFVLALWGGTESPFRCLDEFDVFMDMVNRRICMDMMLQVAREQRARQFIFLSPQNMSYVEYPMAKIFRMPDPIRLKGGQKTLDLPPVEMEEE